MLIQKTVINKYKKALPQEATALAWSAFQAYFLNTDIQQNILQSKEEQFQEGFLRELFVKVLGSPLQEPPPTPQRGRDGRLSAPSTRQSK